jgi:hypothetical protein
MISVARASGSIQELDLLQKEADEILKNTLNCFDDGAVAEDTLSAFNLALDQFHSAVSDRRQRLSGDGLGSRHPAVPPKPSRLT